jgi:anaerobic magnesium-protoporphyrin IX monomethyl ester cyclase
MKIVLVYVGVGVAGFNSDRPDGDREGSWIAHGIASIGASLIEAGHDVSLIDMRQLSGLDHFASIIQREDADIYGLSASSVDHYIALLSAMTIRKTHPECRIVVGGIHPTIFPDKYLGYGIDTIVRGEGEITMLDLARDAENGAKWPDIVVGKKPDLDKVPHEARDLFDYHRELTCTFAPDHPIPSVTMIAGRGCPYRCSYCQPAENSVFGKPHRMRSPENVITELHSLKEKYDFRSITFWDDTFTLNRKWVMRFCDLYESEGFTEPIVAASRADIICRNEGMVERLASIGLDWIQVGLESGSQRILDFIKKDTTVEQNLQAAKICRKHGIKMFATYMYGLPTETRRDSLATAMMIDEIQPEHGSPFYFRPIPGTDIYDYCEANNLILEEAKNASIARTGMFTPTIRGVDYDYIGALMGGYRGQ